MSRRVHRALYTTLLFCVSLALTAADDPYFHSVKAKAGDGVITLLRRYKLHQHQVDVKKFYDINGLKVNQHLHADASYKLPVYIYDYNGKSIRSTVGINDWEQAVRIKDYNEKLLEIGIRATHYTASKILWVPYHELSSDAPTVQKETKVMAKVEAPQPIESNPKSRTVELFGKKHKNVEIEDQLLKNRVYYLVSGHGGIDPGTMCDYYASDLCEDEYAYDVVLRLARNLMQHGATVHVIVQDKNDGIRDGKFLACDTDERMETGQKLHRKQLHRLNQRARRVNDLYKKYQKKGVKEQMMISIHVDANSKSKKQDVFFLHYPESKSSKKLAHDIMGTFDDKYAYHQKGRGYKGHVSDRNLHVLRVTQPRAVLIELANIKNKNDHRRILQHENRQALANWIYEGITKRVPRPSSKEVVTSS